LRRRISQSARERVARGIVELRHAFAQARCIRLGDGERADAALAAARTAGDPRAAAAGGFGH